MKILILAVPVGTGHIKAANAINQAIKSINSRVEVRFENFFHWSHPLYGYAYTKIYDFGQKHARNLLKFFYGGIGIDTSSSDFLYKSHKVLAQRLRYLLRQYKPDYILCTHFSPGYGAAVYKNVYKYKMGIVVTDYYIHPHWANKEIDHFFIPHEYLTEQITSYGVKESQVYPFGIPVAVELEGEIDKGATRKRFDLSKKRISAVVMGSKVFGGEWFELVKEIVDFDYDLLVLCGENKEAMEQIKKLRGKANLHVYGMVERIHELIGTTDILITKAGGITTTEASKAGPCLLFANSIVGLEDKNEEFFIQHGAALRLTKKDAKSVMSDLLSNPKKIDELRSNLKKIGKRETARNIAKVITGSGLNI